MKPVDRFKTGKGKTGTLAFLLFLISSLLQQQTVCQQAAQGRFVWFATPNNYCLPFWEKLKQTQTASHMTPTVKSKGDEHTLACVFALS